MSFRALVCVVAISGLAGCGGGETGPERFDLSGAVTHEGQPVPFGQIIFVPDTDKGGSGPGGTATIENGRYKTVAGKGPPAGPHVALVTGYASQEPEQPGGAPPLLFAERRIELTVAPDQNSLDIEVPAK